ncbi:MAG: DUF1828 domain-containing protein [Pseudomonadota bacterium]
MSVDLQALQQQLCTTFCRDVAVTARNDRIVISLPMTARDGDHLTAYLSQTPTGWRVSDMGSTLMRLSYDHDLSKLLTGARAQLFETILTENGLSEDDGELFLDVPADALPRGIFTLGQGLTRIEDLGLWTSKRVVSTFYDDLRNTLKRCLSSDELMEDFVVPGLPSAENYPVDYCIRTAGRPLFVFGVNSKDKAMLTTIILQHLMQHGQNFESLVVCANLDEIPKLDQRRLMNAANDVVSHVEDVDAIERKIRHRVSA